ncbi:hypothetical protein [Capnocytophaga canis]|uniref:hypothetical protein n=1 Tax=Capnocytophaga canis TaxID=1848903 RepID=UPI0015620E13|nr:hypothetical protein [Capnocytophaga canis]
MGNLVIKPSNKVNIIYPEVVDVYFAKKVEENGVVKFEKIEKGFLDSLMYVIIETNHIKEGFPLKVNVFQYLEKDGEVCLHNTKKEDLIAKVGNYKNKGGTATQAITEIMLGFDNREDSCYYIFSKENRLYVTLSIETSDDEKSYKTICYNLKEYKYNYTDDPNFWYRKNRFELEERKCFCNRDFTVEELRDIVIKLRENTFYNGKSIYYYHQEKLFHRNSQNKIEYSLEVVPDYERNFGTLTSVLNKMFQKYKINLCIQKISFLAQMYIETAYYTATIELNKKEKSYDPYRGRGFIHLTHKGNEDSRTKNATGYLGYKKHSGLDVVETPSIISKSLQQSANSAGWFWTEGVRKNDGSLINLNDKCGKEEGDFKEITRLVKGATTEFNERLSAFQVLLKIFDYEKCTNNK